MIAFTCERIATLALLITLFSSTFALLNGVVVQRLSDGLRVEIPTLFPAKENGDVLVVLGTYSADFNAIEYSQRLRHYLPQLKEKGVNKFAFILNAEPSAAKLLAQLTDLPSEVEIYSDPLGEAGKRFNCSRGWRPDDLTDPYVKLFGMLFGLGAWATLPCVISGYLGNPYFSQPWIESALAQGQRAGRWPDNALELDEDKITIKENKFSQLAIVGSWKRRPLELATLRLQNMLGISLKHWKELKPSDEALKAGVLTQLGGCFVVESKTGKLKYSWRDQGICHVANFEDMLKKLSKNNIELDSNNKLNE